MANQTRQLAGLLRAEGCLVELVRQNRPYVPAWIGAFPWVRALVRLLSYLRSLWRAAGRVELVHVMANSGWSWHLFAAPAIVIGRLRGAAVVVNYRGGRAEQFFNRSYWLVAPVLRLAGAVVVPSGFLNEVFRRRGVLAQVVPNIVDCARFRLDEKVTDVSVRETRGAHLIVARNLESIYDNATAVRAFRIVKDHVPDARMTIAGTGPEEAELKALVESLGLSGSVTFVGRVDNDRMPELYRSADVAINPSLIDNMPNSVLEALASGVPVVSTDVGGVPYLVKHDRTALLVPPCAPERMAQAVLRLVQERGLAERLSEAGRRLAEEYTWERLREKLFTVYTQVLEEGEGKAAAHGTRTHRRVSPRRSSQTDDRRRAGSPDPKREDRRGDSE